MANRALAAHEAAFQLVQEPSAFAAMSSLPHPAPVLFCLTGMDEPVSWPLCAAQAAQIAGLHPDKTISAANIHLDERFMNSYHDMHAAMYRTYVPHLGPSSDVYMELSHLIVDDVGDADSFRLQPSNDDTVNTTTFGMLLVLLPSEHTGGAVTFTFGGHSTTFDDAASLVETPFSAAFLCATITSAPITSGRRVALVYRLYYGDVDGPMRMVPPAQDAAIAAFRAIAQSTTQEVQCVGLELEDMEEQYLSFASLTTWEAGFVHVLLAAGTYGVGLASLDMNRNGVIKAFEPHPTLLHLPPPQSTAFQCPSCVPVYWPTRHRVCIVDPVTVWDVLEQRVCERHGDKAAAYLGVSDTKELLLGMLTTHDLRQLRRERSLSFLQKMQMLLVALKDVALSAAFLDAVAITEALVATKVGPVVHCLLSQHGWEPLQASVLGLVRRWINSDPDATLQLLTSLAGLNTKSVLCRPLRQPYDAELFKRCYGVMLATPGLVGTEMTRFDRGPTFVTGLFLLEDYVTRLVPQRQAANYVSQRLPLIFVPAIDAYLFAYPSVDRLLSSSPLPLLDLAVGLESAVRCHMSLPLPPTVLETIFAAIRPMTADTLTAITTNVASAVLFLACVSQCLDTSLFHSLVDVCGLGLLPTVHSIALEFPNHALLNQLVAAFIDTSVDALVDESQWPEWHLCPVPVRPNDESFAAKPGVLILVDALAFLERMAPSRARAFATRYLQRLPTTLSMIHDRLVPVLTRLGCHSGAYDVLVEATIDRFAALPHLADYTLPRPWTLNPNHCPQHDPYEIVRKRRRRLSETNACCRRERKPVIVLGEDQPFPRVYVLEKVRQPGDVADAEWYMAEKMRKIHAHVSAFVTTLVRQRQDDDAAASVTNAPPAKRLRS
ncbi:hypothetical protein SDRG_08761 [Saprolegnia diclina VS20]|uniref:Uncharacterized protein n=1 Tax=Saprolegnia diclina (strain VS20) TaxID=1156394 RepID=T0RTL5_SAPDV|nr:hypothetical protein SDRG_08761 [Saprolegnia diclina VS20]EQC33657.1 hypothetical protein SDRG_08761 [Saprolegnia diclina VS20]|eukprot:XP_008612880.1 hypothetical protein SDRG_08761 [Saprolegnia diclina VS20]